MKITDNHQIRRNNHWLQCLVRKPRKREIRVTCRLPIQHNIIIRYGEIIIGCSVLLGSQGRGKCVLQVDCRHHHNIIIRYERYGEVIIGCNVLLGGSGNGKCFLCIKVFTNPSSSCSICAQLQKCIRLIIDIILVRVAHFTNTCLVVKQEKTMCYEYNRSSIQP